MQFLLLAATLALSFAASAESKQPATPWCASPDAAVNHDTYLQVGGIEQWVSVRGAKCSNPVILVVHGGPGNPVSPYADALYGSWTKDFTVVQWDQRASGRTFERSPASEDDLLTLKQMTGDGVAVAAQVARALDQEKVILVGGSWGSALAVHMIRQRPAAFHAYIGTGQMVEETENLKSSFGKVTALVKAASDTAGLAVLEQIGPPPWTNPRSFGALRRLTRKYEAQVTTPAPENWWKRSALYSTPEALAAYEGGEDYSYVQLVGMTGKGMLSHVDLYALGSSFEVPIHLVQGTEDLVTTPEVARRWFDAVKAPAKSFVLVPKTGHDPNVAMLDAQYQLLLRVRERLTNHAPANRVQ